MKTLIKAVLVASCVGTYCTNDAGQYDWKASSNRYEQESRRAQERAFHEMQRQSDRAEREWQRTQDRWDAKDRHQETMRELRRTRETNLGPIY